MSAPIESVDFDLDAVERQKTYKQFSFNWKGRRLTASDPAELDYRKLLEIETPLAFLRYTMSEDDRDYLAANEMESWRLNLLMEAYYRHFGMDKDRSKLGF